MDAVESSRIGPTLAWIDRALDAELRGVTAVQQRALRARIAATRLGDEEIASLSAVFLSERRRAAAGVLGAAAFAVPGVRFILLPLAGAIAAVYGARERESVIVLSLGLVEILRLGCAASLLHSRLLQLESSERLRQEMGHRAHERAAAVVRRMIAYLNASAVRSFLVSDRVPNALAGLDAESRRRTDIVLEAVLMFVLLHELGHVDFARVGRAPRLVWELAVPEELDARQAEELYADRFAIEAVPSAFRIHLVHAATFMLHLHGYTEVLRSGVARDHPLAVNRIAAMELAAGPHPEGEVGRAAVRSAIDAGSGWWSASDDAGSRLAALTRFVAAHEGYDWRPAQEALLAITDSTPGDLSAAAHDRGRSVG